MSVIHLQTPTPMGRDLERLNYFPGRALGEQAFDRRQAYADARLAPLADAGPAGVVRGLEVRTAAADTPGNGCVVSPGLAVTGNGGVIALYAPLRQDWQDLVGDYLERTGAADAAGVFHLVLRRDWQQVDADPETDPCQRTYLDPHRDARRLVVTTLGLRRLAIPAADVAGQPRERIANRVAAERVDGTFLRGLGDAVPVGLLAVEPDGDGYRVAWFSQAAGRYPATADGGYRVLLAQVDAALQRALNAPPGESTPPALDFLPAAGALPSALLGNVADRRPTIAWLPGHLGVDMVPVPEDNAAALVQRHLPRRPVDLRRPRGERLRLLLAVDETDYRPDLLDFPRRDAQLIRDVFRHHRRAHEAWRDWRRQYNHLYFVHDGVDLDTQDMDALDLPEPEAPPRLPGDVFQDLVQTAATELGDGETPPYPYDQETPAAPQSYRDWLVPSDPQGPSAGLEPPGVDAPAQNGLVIRYALARHELERTENRIRAVRARLDKTRDYILVQRQQLDSQTVSYASLAGGVAGDGAGLQVSRWLPYTSLSTASGLTETSNATGNTDGSGGGSTTDATSNATSGGGSTGGQIEGLQLNATFSAIAPVQLTSAGSRSADLTATNAVAEAQAVKTLSATSTREFLFKPSKTSALELNINRRRLAQLADAPRQTLTKPSFVAREERFGVLSHIKPEESEYRSAHRGMAELVTTVDGLFDTAEASSIKKGLRRQGTLRDPDAINQAETDGEATAGVDPWDANVRQRHYEELFKAGRVLARQIGFMEARQSRLEAQLQARLRDRDRLLGQLDKLAGLITEAREKLAGLDGRRVEALGDYGVAQKLLDEDWRDVHARNETRTEILTRRLRGVYFVRVRDAAVARPPADPLALRHAAPDEPVPGCDWDEAAELPEALAPFFEAVLEVPVDDWRALRPLRFLLPPPAQLDVLFQLRRTRFQLRPQKPVMATAVAAPRLRTLAAQNRAILQDFGGRALPRLQGSLRRVHEQTARTLSLEDVLAGAGSGRLRRQGEQLRRRLEQAGACLLSLLRRLPPSLRLQWAELAEEDRLRADRVAGWPGLEQAEREAFNTTRTLAELVDWWSARLEPDAEAASRSALRNVVRAAVIQAALGDPADILQGRVRVPPRRLLPGERLRLDLNRLPNLGDTLQLLDPVQRVVGTVRVEDHDERGTVADVVEVAQPNVSVTTGFTAVASRMVREAR